MEAPVTMALLLLPLEPLPLAAAGLQETALTPAQVPVEKFGSPYSPRKEQIMAHKCLLDSATKVVINVIELEDGVVWTPPAGTELAPQHNGNIGDTWDGTQFVAPPPPPEPEVVQPISTGAQEL